MSATNVLNKLFCGVLALGLAFGATAAAAAGPGFLLSGLSAGSGRQYFSGRVVPELRPAEIQQGSANRGRDAG